MVPRTGDPLMPYEQWFDDWPTWILALGTGIVFALASELSYRAARALHDMGKPEAEDRKAQTAVLVSALLALLSLLLAFSFSIVETRYGERKQLVLQEANAIRTAYLRARMLPAPHADRLRAQLRQYVSLRTPKSPQQLQQALESSEKLHSALWTEATAAVKSAPDPSSELFVSSLNEVIDLHAKRVTVVQYHRLPAAIIGTIYLLGVLSMGGIGYSGGLSRKRAHLPSLAVLVAISTVTVMIVEFDRPKQRMFELSLRTLDDVRIAMTRDPD
jgi:membrane protein YdbS with pleckstrin-like domain